jgi:hypothetical protein
MWTYCSVNGNLSQNNRFVGKGYSGLGEGLNNPEWECVEGVGPLPRGHYTIEPFFNDPGGKGAIVAHLRPMQDTITFGRAGFMIHGDNAAMNHTASHGCIILARENRREMASAADDSLEVV